MRLFFAVLLSEEVREAVKRVQEELRASIGDKGVKWVLPEHFHYTLKFLGETADANVPSAIGAAHAVAAQIIPFALTLTGIGAFPKLTRPQIVWAGASDGVPLLTHCAELLEDALAERGFERENKPFNPHLTLARTKTREGEEAVAKTLVALPSDLEKVDKIGVIQAENFVLMRSELHPTGPIYTVVETFAFAPKEKG